MIGTGPVKRLAGIADNDSLDDGLDNGPDSAPGESVFLRLGRADQSASPGRNAR